MREAKFRAWDKAEKKMCGVTVLTWDGKISGAFLVGNSPTKESASDDGEFIIGGIPDGHFCPIKDIELMEYTGLKDKNGKEIYEGDIVNVRTNKGNEQPVVFRGKYSWCLDWGNESGDELSAIGEDAVKVIGNIRENPELIGDKK